MIYRVIDLSQCGPKRLESWSNTVTRRSHLAERVHTLKLALDCAMELTSNPAKLARALAKCVNLKELSVRNTTPGFDQFNMEHRRSIQTWILNTCKFRLHKFDNDFFKISMLSQFWSLQSDIRSLALPNYGEKFPCHDDQLPNLISLKVDDLKTLPEERPLERIEVFMPFSMLDRLVAVLSQYSPTLTTLNLAQCYFHDASQIYAVFTTVALAVPSLLHFGFIEKPNMYLSTQELDSPIAALAGFTRLETFFFHSFRITTFFDQNSGDTYDLCDPGDLEVLGRATMHAGRTLHRATFSHELEDDTSHVVCTVTRSGPEEVIQLQVEHPTEFDLSKISMM
ncbi:hypothetical protein FB45DRAFT_1018861 [Roridomyces roridus]|uniref:Uncharacterized protein n=1 Tax=Roridomyces roridus TaxID=1738132 RepID=A0AAD7CDS6_9AGAR|nr:hypothetical protein FB45DRAFT_1018861 [Roridomyces roridus]